jgi:hypothetical protein
MTFISIKDRPACIAAMVELFNHLKSVPGLISPMDATEAEATGIQQICENAWDEETDDKRKEVLLAVWQSLCIPASYYECHLTFDAFTQGRISEWDRRCEQIDEIGQKYHFRFSKIEGDEQMGPGVRWYLTRSLKDGPTLTNDMNALTYALTQAGVPILRRKIEHIVFDERRDKIAGTRRAS